MRWVVRGAVHAAAAAARMSQAGAVAASHCWKHLVLVLRVAAKRHGRVHPTGSDFVDPAAVQQAGMALGQCLPTLTDQSGLGRMRHWHRRLPTTLALDRARQSRKRIGGPWNRTREWKERWARCNSGLAVCFRSFTRRIVHPTHVSERQPYSTGNHRQICPQPAYVHSHAPAPPPSPSCSQTPSIPTVPTMSIQLPVHSCH